MVEPITVPEPIGSIPPSSDNRKERKYKGSSKPDYIDSHSWTSMSPSLRKHMIKLDKEQKEKERLAATPTPQPTVSSSSSVAAAPVPKHDKIEILQDLFNDICVDVEETPNGSNIFLCLTHQRTIPKGTIYYPKGETVLKMPKDTWGFVVGLADAESNQQFNVTQKGDLNGLTPSSCA